MRIRSHNIILSFLFLVGFCALAIGQYTIPKKPKGKDQKGVYDYNNLLAPSQEHALDQKLIRYADTTSTQIVVVVISSSKGEELDLLGAQWGQKWGIGQAKEDNGILIILAKNDRKVDINTGYGIESIISDRDAKRVIERTMIPQFKKGNFYAGLDQGTDALIQMLEGEFEGTPSSSNSSSIGRFIILFVIFMVILILLSRGNRGSRNDGGRKGRAGSLLDVIILSNMGRGSWGGGSSSGGSSWGGGGGFGGGFGGGGFGGGGASGGW